MRLIDADALKEKLFIADDNLNPIVTATEIDEAPTVKAVPLKEIFRIIAGHSDYHGDSILSALLCITEGKEVKPIKPIEV